MKTSAEKKQNKNNTPCFLWSWGCLKATWKIPWIFLQEAKWLFAAAARTESSCYVAGGRQHRQDGVTRRGDTSSSLLLPPSPSPPPGFDGSTVKGRAPSAVIFPFSWGAWQPLLLNSNALSFKIGNSNTLNMQMGGICKPVTQSRRGSTGTFGSRKAWMHKMQDILLMICFYLFSKTNVKEFKGWINS